VKPKKLLAFAFGVAVAAALASVANLPAAAQVIVSLQQINIAPNSYPFSELGLSTPITALAQRGGGRTVALPAGLGQAIWAALGAADDSCKLVQELTASDAAPGDFFGTSVALSSDGHVALIGAPRNERSPASPGVAYIFTQDHNVWTEQQELTASDGSPIDFFGSSVALSGDGHVALIGAWGKDASAGAAYVFTGNRYGWTQQQELTTSDAAPLSAFGYALALDYDGHVALIGARLKNGFSGAAYIFTQSGNTYTQQQELTVGPSSDFGVSVALSGDGHIALIGADFANGGVGTAFVFTQNPNTYTLQQELTTSDEAVNDFLGSAVALSNDGHIALIGAYNKNSATGAAYVFAENHNTYTEQQKLTASDAATNTGFGWSVALDVDGHTALIGVGPFFVGVAYVFTEDHGTYTQQQELTASDAPGQDRFGSSVALDNDGHITLIGAPNKNAAEPPYYEGAAYVYTQ
jgi:hypothetical protein